MERPGPDAVIFDLDGTLVDREQVLAEAAGVVMAAAGRPLRPEEMAHTVGRAWVDVHDHLGIGDSVGWDVDEFVDRIVEAAEGLAASGRTMPAVAGGRELIERLRAGGTPVAVVTGSRRSEADEALRRLGVWDLLDLVLAAEDYAPGKPHPAGFLAAAAYLGASPARCVVLEDSWAGVAAARAAGMAVIAVTQVNPPPDHPSHQDLTSAHHHVRDHREVTDGALADVLAALALPFREPSA